MRRRGATGLATLVVCVAAACADGTGPTGSAGPQLPVMLSVQPSSVSPAETGALQTAFDQVDSYRVLVADSTTDAAIVDVSADVPSGLTSHALDVDLPETSVGQVVSVTVIGLDDEQELYRASGYTTVEIQTSQALPLILSVRYTGPGIRGSVVDTSGDGIGGLTVDLVQGTSTVVETATTEPDGTYIFVDVLPGAYRVDPADPGTGEICPGDRSVDLATGASLVADFVASAVPCSVDLLILGSGDFDETAAVETMLSGVPGLTTETFFFVNQTPGLATLRQYDVVLVFANGLFDNSPALGSELAAYVEAGGNIVMGSFYWQVRSDSNLGSPGWGALESIDPLTSSVDPFTQRGGATYQLNALDGVNIQPHPLTAGVTSITSIAGFGSGVAAKVGTTVVALWTDGDPFVGYRVLSAGQRIVAVSLFPAASEPDQVEGDVAQLWENAVVWAGQAGGPPPQ